jgi:hypothetical protein
LHDTVWFEIQGIPSVTVASIEFEEAANIQARALGLEDARCVFVSHPIQDANDDQIRSKADDVIDAVVQALAEKS